MEALLVAFLSLIPLWLLGRAITLGNRVTREGKAQKRLESTGQPDWEMAEGGASSSAAPDARSRKQQTPSSASGHPDIKFPYRDERLGITYQSYADFQRQLKLGARDAWQMPDARLIASIYGQVGYVGLDLPTQESIDRWAAQPGMRTSITSDEKNFLSALDRLIDAKMLTQEEAAAATERFFR